MARLWLQDKEDISVVLLGLKRDLRVEGEGVVYPQEVCHEGEDKQSHRCFVSMNPG